MCKPDCNRIARIALQFLVFSNLAGFSCPSRLSFGADLHGLNWLRRPRNSQSKGYRARAAAQQSGECFSEGEQA
jgi:hypothetical protein